MLTEKQQEARKSGIGGSDVGAICGLNPKRTPIDVYLEKIGEKPPEDLSNNDAVHFGNVLEDIVAQEYVRRHNVKVRRKNKMIRHPKYPWMIANLDRVVDGQEKVLECKTGGEWSSKCWGEAGTDQIPEIYILQCIHYMIVTGYRNCDLAVLIAGQNFRTYPIPWDQDLADLVISKEREFWDYVEGKTPPPCINAHDIESLYPVDNDNDLTGDAVTIGKLEQLSALKAQIKMLEGEKISYEQDIKLALSAHSRLRDSNKNLLASWRKAKDGKKFNEDQFKKDFPELHEKYQITKPGTRRFLVKI